MIKKNIVGLMLKTPEALQRQLSDAITIIGEWSGGRGRENSKSKNRELDISYHVL